MKEITQEKLFERFNYIDGKLMHKKHGIGRQVGKHAGTISHEGYRRIEIHGKFFLEHRLVWLWHYGYLPIFLDHINRIRDDNHIENLREANKSQNGFNTNKQKNKSSKYKGVSFDKSRNKWCARIKTKYLGRFNTEEEAARSYNEQLIKTKCKYGVLNKV